MLGVTKDAAGDHIKKSYRKLALKFHPDKNSAPSAEGAFKAISAAFDCLSDPKKREMYDQYGHDGDNVSSGHGGGGGGFHSGGFHGTEINPEDIFRAFFQQAGPGFQSQFGGGGPGFQSFHFGPGGAQFRRRRTGGSGRAQEEDEQAHQGQQRANGGGVTWFQQILQILPFLLMFLSFTSYSSNSYSQPLYSLNPTGSYQIPRETKSPGISQNIPYYINNQQKFDKSYRPYSDALKKIEKEVEYEYKSFLNLQCKHERDMKNNKIFKVRFMK